MYRLTFLFVFLSLLSASARGDVRLPGFFGDHMVLQRQMKLRLWGWADANESVTVTLAGNSAKTTADAKGNWKVELPPMEANSNGVVLSVQGHNSIEINDVLVGEVWLCSGQSNMEWTVRSSSNAAQEIAEAKHPLIRHMKVNHRPSTSPLQDIQSSWKICSPETAADFTACGYFMARRLQKELNVPIGLINSSWGGTRVEPWTTPQGFSQVPALKTIHDSVVGRTPSSPQYQNRLQQHMTATSEWLVTAKQALAKNADLQPSPSYPAELMPFKSHQDPTMLYNGMIHALVGFPIRGAIWYQGESNHVEGMSYFEKKKALINGWRYAWGQGDFPFYYVQIAPFNYGSAPNVLAELWEAQAAVQKIPNTGMVVINDIATLNDIHPPNKQDVGARLAMLALKHDYGKAELVARSPEFDSLEVLDGKLKVKFKNGAGGLKTRDGKSPSHFELVGIGSNGFHPATATIEGDTVILVSEKVKSPTAFRFAWHKLAQPNLMGGTGLPVGAVRAGKVPEFLDSVSGADDYQMIYDLDLSKLNAEIEYDVNNSQQVGSFDRIGYLLELESSQQPQKIFVTMKAFTQDVKKVGIPTVESGSNFRQKVTDMNVFSNVSSVKSGTKIETGNIEFWPNNYEPSNQRNVSGASDSVYDFGDSPASPSNGYGSMQIHNFGEGQTLFAINHWSSGASADLGIGNSDGNTRDWTFKQNAGSYQSKRLRVYVRPVK